MISINNVDHINLNVKDLSQSVEFYKKFFSLENKEEGLNTIGNPYVIIGLSNKLHLVLHQSQKALENKVLNHFGIHVNNFEEVVNALKNENVPLLYGGDVVEYENSRSVYIADPDGNEIELSSKFGGGL